MSDQAAVDGAGYEEHRPASVMIREMRQEVRAAKKLAAEHAALQREHQALKTDVALRDLNLNEDQRQALLAVHGDAPLTAEAFAATAERLSFVEPQQTTAEERAIHAQMDALTSAAPPSEAHRQTLQEEMEQAPTREALEAILARERMLEVQ